VQCFPGKQTKFIADTMVNWEPVQITPNMNVELIAGGAWTTTRARTTQCIG